MRSFLMYALVSAFIFVGCSDDSENLFNNSQDENDFTFPEFDFSVENVNNTLVFETVEDYRKAISFLSSIGDENFDTWESLLQFDSFRKVNGLEEGSFVVDELLASLINYNGAIIIGDYKFLLNDETHKVEVYEGKGELKSSSFIEEANPESDLIDKYFFSENYNEDKDSATEGILKSFIGNDKDGYHYFNGAHGSKVKSKVVYQAAGIYYSLQSKIKYENKVGCGGSTIIGLIVQPGCKYTRRRGLFSRRTSTHQIPEVSRDGNCREYNYRAYEDVYRLTKYNFSVLFYYDDSNGESGEGILSINR